MPRVLRLLSLLLLLAEAASCGGEIVTGPTPHPDSTIVTIAPGPPVPLLAAGDIAVCGSAAAEATARLIDGLPGTVITLGDNAYPSGSADSFRDCYGPTWGRHKARTRPSPGNHDYEQPGAVPYFNYFGVNAGPSGLGYYRFHLGEWQIYSLNSNVPMGTGSSQMQWLRRELAANPSACTLAYWHHPLFSSGPNGDTAVMREIWTILQQGGADVVVSGHDHLYERFAPQDAGGRANPRGLREFVAGTGGAHLYAPRSIRPNSEVISSTHGVLKLTLKPESYEWQFVPIPGKSFTDFGTAPCNTDRAITATTSGR